VMSILVVTDTLMREPPRSGLVQLEIEIPTSRSNFIKFDAEKSFAVSSMKRFFFFPGIDDYPCFVFYNSFANV